MLRARAWRLYKGFTMVLRSDLMKLRRSLKGIEVFRISGFTAWDNAKEGSRSLTVGFGIPLFKAS